jgi:hypothetical protein
MMGKWDPTAVSPANHGAGWQRCRSMRNQIEPRVLLADHSAARDMARTATTLRNRGGQVPSY